MMNIRSRAPSFSLVEVMLAVAIVGIAVGSCFQIFHAVRRINSRAHFYAKVLPFIRQEFESIVTGHRFVSNLTLGNTPSEGVTYVLQGQIDPEFPRCQRVTARFHFEDNYGKEHRLTFETCVSQDIVNKSEEK